MVIEKKLKQTFGRLGSIVDVQMYNRNIEEFGMQLRNSCWLVVNFQQRHEYACGEVCMGCPIAMR